MPADSNEVRWILGFDGWCLSCTALARQLEALSDGRLTARSLREPEVQAWRAQTLGADAPWTPALFAVGDGRVRAWRRLGMAWRLSRLLGPGKMWQIARLLGESGVSTDGATNPARRQFVKTVGGAAFGLAILQGIKAFNPLPAAGAGETTIKLADARTRDRMLKKAGKDDGVRLLSARLHKDGFGVSKAPSVFVAQEGGQALRTAVVTEYSAAGGMTATLGFSVEPDGQSLAQALVAKDGELSHGLRVNNAGAVEIITPGVVAASTNCNLCKGICNFGGCGLGCFTVSILFCGIGAPICSTICRALCSLGADVPCDVACTQLGYCP